MYVFINIRTHPVVRNMAETYLDWNDSLDVLKRAYNAGLFTIIIGPKGTGKTSLVRQFASLANKELQSVNFSLRTRESHLIGSKTLDKGEINFVEGILVKSMRGGGLLYLDELNAAEADVLLRLDEALDDRRQVVLKEADGQVITAREDWSVIATLMSRFPVRIRLEYPPENVELEIIMRHVSNIQDSKLEDVKRVIKLAKSLRDAAAVEELYYSPSLRETIAFTKLLNAEMQAKRTAEIVFANVYDQWGEVEFRKVMDMVISVFGD
jgi:nitric oxide reductase NorQ protein